MPKHEFLHQAQFKKHGIPAVLMRYVFYGVKNLIRYGKLRLISVRSLLKLRRGHLPPGPKGPAKALTADAGRDPVILCDV